MEIMSTDYLQNFEILNEILGFEYLENVQIQILDKMLITNASKIKKDMKNILFELNEVEEYANPRQQMIELISSYIRLEDMITNIEKVRHLLRQRINHGYPD